MKFNEEMVNYFYEIAVSKCEEVEKKLEEYQEYRDARDEETATEMALKETAGPQKLDLFLDVRNELEAAKILEAYLLGFKEGALNGLIQQDGVESLLEKVRERYFNSGEVVRDG